MERTDGVVTIQTPVPDDVPILVAGRDEEFHRWMGPGAEKPDPTAVIVVGGEVVGWVDFDSGHEWLGPGEVNVGYSLAPAHRGGGYATRAVELLVQHLAEETPHATATLSIDARNTRSLAVAARAGFVERSEREGSRLFERPLRP